MLLRQVDGNRTQKKKSNAQELTGKLEDTFLLCTDKFTCLLVLSCNFSKSTFRAWLEHSSVELFKFGPGELLTYFMQTDF